MAPLQDTGRSRFYLWLGLAFWGLWFFSDLANHPESILLRGINTAWRLVFVLALNIVLFEYSIPFVLRRRPRLLTNILWGFALLFVHLMLYSWGLYGWRALGIALHVYTPLVSFASLMHAVTDQMVFSTMTVFFFGIARHVYGHVLLRQAARQLRIEKQEAELNYLKAQTNPHFLFNTLNNIYALAREKSDLAPESILRLSKIMRYMLYEAGSEQASIEQELKVIADYIALEKLRYDETLRVNFHHDVEDARQVLPPLLLMPLVENAFKHGASETTGQPFVDVALTVKAQQLTFTVRNSAEETAPEDPVRENIGLSNLRRQLALLYRDYRLSASRGSHQFTATLFINLASHVETQLHHHRR